MNDAPVLVVVGGGVRIELVCWYGQDSLAEELVDEQRLGSVARAEDN